MSNLSNNMKKKGDVAISLNRYLVLNVQNVGLLLETVIGGNMIEIRIVTPVICLCVAIAQIVEGRL